MKNFYKKSFTLLCIVFLINHINTFAKNDNQNKLQSAISTPTKFIQQDFDVLSYYPKIHFVDIPNKKINAENTITFVWLMRTDTSKFYFHLRGLSIDSVFYNNKLVPYNKVGDTTSATYHFEITPPKLDLADTVQVRIVYHGSMTNEGGVQAWGGVHYQDTTLFALGVGFLNNYVCTTEHWMPCYDHPSDKALFQADFYAPEGYTVISNGIGSLVSKNNGISLWRYSLNEPVATYLLTFVIGNFEKLTFTGANIPIIVYANSQDTTASNYAFKKTPEMLNYFTEIYGNYPFESLGYVLTKLGSMESQTMINFFKPLVFATYSQKDSMNLTAAHEMSHQWLGNSVTPLDFRDTWLNESFATYSESLWKEHVLGFQSYLLEQENKMTKYFKNIVPLEGIIPLYDYPRTSATSNYPTTIYYKGALVLGMLRFKLGDSVFFSTLKSYLNTYQYQNSSTELLKSFFEEHSSQNLTQFFDQWVYKAGWPKIDITLNVDELPNNKTILHSVLIEQNNPSDWGLFLDLPISITIKQSDGNIIDTVVTMNGNALTIPFNDIPIDTVLINKGNKVKTLMQLQSYKINNLLSVQSNVPKPIHFNLYERNLSISLPEMNDEIQMRIYDYLGRESFSENFYDKQEIFVNLQKLNQGFYTITLINKGILIYTNKIILQ
jgi:aminopeptidase N